MKQDRCLMCAICDTGILVLAGLRIASATSEPRRRDFFPALKPNQGLCVSVQTWGKLSSESEIRSSISGARGPNGKQTPMVANLDMARQYRARANAMSYSAEILI